MADSVGMPTGANTMSPLATALVSHLREFAVSGQSWADWSFGARFTSTEMLAVAAQIIAGNY